VIGCNSKLLDDQSSSLYKPTYKPSNAELTAIRKGETGIACGQHVSLAELLNALAPDNRKGGSKTSRRVSR
jgi:hypothetical protein